MNVTMTLHRGAFSCFPSGAWLSSAQLHYGACSGVDLLVSAGKWVNLLLCRTLESHRQMHGLGVCWEAVS